jgi:hypothetical protein
MTGHALGNFSVPSSAFLFDGSHLQQETVSFSYEPLPLTTTPGLLADAEYTNDTDAQGIETFANTKSTTAVQQFSVTNGYTIGVGVEIHVGLPVIGGSVRGQYDVSCSKTEMQSISETESWTWSATIPVPPRSRVVASVILQRASYNPRFSARVRVRGKVTWSYSRPRTEYSAVWDIGSLLAHFPYPGVTVIDDSTIEIAIDGQLVGVQGLRTIVKVQQFKIDTGELVSERSAG